MTFDRKEHYKLKNDLELKIYRKCDKQRLLMEKLGMIEIQERNTGKVVLKHTAINKRDTNNIKITESIYSKSLQRSDYLKVDNQLMQEIHKNPEKLKLLNEKSNQHRKLAPGEFSNEVELANNNQIFLKYCKTEDIKQQQQGKIMYKASFLAKLQHLKMQGQCLDHLSDIERHIDHELYRLL